MGGVLLQVHTPHLGTVFGVIRVFIQHFRCTLKKLQLTCFLQAFENLPDMFVSLGYHVNVAKMEPIFLPLGVQLELAIYVWKNLNQPKKIGYLWYWGRLDSAEYPDKNHGRCPWPGWYLSRNGWNRILSRGCGRKHFFSRQYFQLPKFCANAVQAGGRMQTDLLEKPGRKPLLIKNTTDESGAVKKLPRFCFIPPIKDNRIIVW